MDVSSKHGYISSPVTPQQIIFSSVRFWRLCITCGFILVRYYAHSPVLKFTYYVDKMCSVFETKHFFFYFNTLRWRRPWTPQETMTIRRCRNRSSDLIHGGRWWWWWWLYDGQSPQVMIASNINFLVCFVNKLLLSNFQQTNLILTVKSFIADHYVSTLVLWIYFKLHSRM